MATQPDDDYLPEEESGTCPLESPTLRRVAGVILGAVLGVIVFFVLVLVVGMANDSFSLGIPLDTNIAENIWSAIMLFVTIILGIVVVSWAVMKRDLARFSESSGN